MRGRMIPVGFAFAALFAIAYPVKSTAGPWYAGFAGGVSGSEGSDLENSYPVDGSRFPPRVVSSYLDQNRHTWRALVGLRPKDFLAVELNYSDYGTQNLGYRGRRDMPFGPAFFIPQVTAEGRRTVTALGIDVIGHWPLSSKLTALLGVGLVRATVKLDSDFSTIVGFPPARNSSTSASERSMVVRYSLGGSWTFDPRWALQAKFEYLPEIGSDFASGTESHTGRSSQQTFWLSVERNF